MTLSPATVVVLDRDGVINLDSPDYIKSADEWQAIPGSLDAIARLNLAGFTVAVATNQSGVGRGLFSESTLNEIHQKMLAEIAAHGGEVAQIFYCPHAPEEHCDCRKPKPGLLYKAAEHFACGFQRMIVIGDSVRDIEAARAVGARAILVRTGKGVGSERSFTPDNLPETENNLAAAADKLINERGTHS